MKFLGIDSSDFLCQSKFKLARKYLCGHQGAWILDVGCGNHSPSATRHWFPTCHYAGADIQRYNLDEEDDKAMDVFFPVGADGSGYSQIPDNFYDLILLNHVIEHMRNSAAVLAVLCSKLKAGGFIWIAFPSARSLSLPPAAKGTLQFCDDETHIYVPDVREVSNVLLSNGIRVLNAGPTRDFIRGLRGALLFPFFAAGSCHPRGFAFWHLLGFEDHVFGQRRFG